MVDIIYARKDDEPLWELERWLHHEHHSGWRLNRCHTAEQIVERLERIKRRSTRLGVNGIKRLGVYAVITDIGSESEPYIINGAVKNGVQLFFDSNDSPYEVINYIQTYLDRQREKGIEVENGNHEEVHQESLSD